MSDDPSLANAERNRVEGVKSLQEYCVSEEVGAYCHNGTIEFLREAKDFFLKKCTAPEEGSTVGCTCPV